MKKFSEYITEGKITAQEVEDYIREELGYGTDVKVVDKYLEFEVLIGKTGNTFDNFLEKLKDKFGKRKVDFYEWVKPSHERALFKIKI